MGVPSVFAGANLPSQALRLTAQVPAYEDLANSDRFLLAQLYFESLQGKDTPWAIKEALREMVPGTQTNTAYSTAYTNAVERIKQRKPDWGRAKQVLGWITCAKRQLHEVELQHALAVEPGDLMLNHDKIPLIERLVSVCAGLVIIDKQSGIIRLVHYTAQDYFESEKARWFPDIESIMTRVCTTYLSFDSFAAGRCHTDEEFEERLANHRLYDYAAKNWGLHARAANTDGAPEIRSFLLKPHQVHAASQPLPDYRSRISYGRDHTLVTALHLAAFFGLAWVIESIVDTQTIDVQDELDQTSLYLASLHGYRETAKVLVEKGANVNATGFHGQAPLYAASVFGHAEVVKLLLERGADVDIPSVVGRTPLYAACLAGHVEVVKLLVEKGADVDIPDHFGETPLDPASSHGHAEVVKLLLEKGANVDVPDNVGKTPLHAASLHGSAEAVRLLLEKGADVNFVAVDGCTSLYYACLEGHGEVARLLIENGANVIWPERAADDEQREWVEKWRKEWFGSRLFGMGIKMSLGIPMPDRPHSPSLVLTSSLETPTSSQSLVLEALPLLEKAASLGYQW